MTNPYAGFDVEKAAKATGSVKYYAVIIFLITVVSSLVVIFYTKHKRLQGSFAPDV